MGKIIKKLIIGVIISVCLCLATLYGMRIGFDAEWFAFLCRYNLMPFVWAMPTVFFGVSALRKEG